jgi:hypothetical protein
VNKQKITAIYCGECYDKGYGRKLYKKAILLKDVKDEKGNILFEKVKVSKTKSLSNLTTGQKITILANVTNEKINYVTLVS